MSEAAPRCKGIAHYPSLTFLGRFIACQFGDLGFLLEHNTESRWLSNS